MKFLILDLDQTIIDDFPVSERLCRAAAGVHHGDAIYTRPHLAEFLEWAFIYFDGVGLWTKASKDWLDAALGTSPLADFADLFAFKWTGERCSRASCSVYNQSLRCTDMDMDMHRRPFTKPLRKIWRQKKLRVAGWGRRNTVIVDDQPENFMDNYGNGVVVPPFDAKNFDSDTVLLDLMHYLSSSPMFAAGNVRTFEKRDWLQRARECLFDTNELSKYP